MGNKYHHLTLFLFELTEIRRRFISEDAGNYFVISETFLYNKKMIYTSNNHIVIKRGV